MTMKKILLIILAALAVAPSVDAVKMKDLKVYVNPGHGGYGNDDRGMDIWPYCAVVEESMWESKSNLWKGLHLRDILQKFGTTVMMSRITNTEDDDRSLAAIGHEAVNWGADMFFSIHSNAGENVNYPLMIYHAGGKIDDWTGKTTVYREENKRISEIVNDVFNTSKYSNWIDYRGQLDNESAGRVTSDVALLGYSLGVLRNLDGIGMLSEGGMHEHRPQAHRLMSDDYCWLEAWYFAKAVMIYFNTEDRFTTGNIAGVMYDNHNVREWEYTGVYKKHTMRGRDVYMPVNNAEVQLIDATGNVLDTRNTGPDYNGVFVFREVAPGTYTIKTIHDNYYTETKEVTVVADETTYQDMPVTYKREAPLKVMNYSPQVAEGELVSCSTPLTFEFNWDVDVEAFENAFSVVPAVDGYFEYSKSFRNVSFIPTISFDKDTEYTVTIAKTACTTDNIYSHPQMEADLVFKFKTLNRDKMEVLGVYPAENAQVHYAKPSFEVRFDQQIDATNISSKVAIYDSNNNKVSIPSRNGFAYNKLANGYGNLTVTLVSNLNIGEQYRFVVLGDGAIRDLGDIPLKEQIEVKFTASDESASATGTLHEGFNDAALFAYNVDETKGITATTPKYIKNTTQYLFDKASGKFTYDFASNRDGVIVWDYAGTEEKQVEKGDILGMYVYGDFNNHELYVGVTSGTDTKYEKVCDLNFRGWKYFEVAMNSLEKSETVPYYALSHLKLIQVTSPITQKGEFSIDNMMRSTSAGVEDVVADATSQVKVFPNPATDVVHVQSPVEVDALELVNIQGAKVAEAQGTDKIAVGNLPQGVYFLRVISDGTVTSHRVVVSK